MFDERGCLTDSGVATVRAAPAGGIPPELAAHLAECDRCQGRVLAEGQPRLVRAKPPTYQATLIVFVAIMFALVVLALALQMLRRG